MIYQIIFPQISHRSVDICKVYYSNVRKKHDLSNNVFCKYHITVWAFVRFIIQMWGRYMIFQIMFPANIESQLRYLQGLLWLLIHIRDNNCVLLFFLFMNSYNVLLQIFIGWCTLATFISICVFFKSSSPLISFNDILPS